MLRLEPMTAEASVGLFFVRMKSGQQRIIFATRLGNCDFGPPPSTHLPSASAFAKMETSECDVVWYSVGVALVTAPFALWVWSAPSPGELMLMIMTGLFATTAQFFFIRAFRRADASFLAPMFYFHIVPATLIGLFVFAEIPSINTMAGAAVILASLVIMTLLERRRQ